MTETTMPTAEAPSTGVADERTSYEYAFHVLPTVVEGEVAEILTRLKAHITKAGGEIFDEESPERIDLAYEITKSIEGTYRRFGSAYFGWVRFKLEGGKVTGLNEELEADPQVLRSLTVKLTKVEEEKPFRFHEHRKSKKMSEVVGDEDGATDGEGTKDSVPLATEEKKEEDTKE